MCWSAEVSLNTFLISTLALIVLYTMNYDAFHIALVFSFVIMQLIEYFMWIYIHQPSILQIFGFLSFVLIFVQPIIILLFTNYCWLIPYYILLHILWLIVCIFFTNLQFQFMPYVAKNKHLAWNWSKNQIYIYGFFAIYLTFWLGTIYKFGFFAIFILAVLTLLYSIYNYNEYNTMSSMWCWIANLFIIILVIDALYKMHLNNKLTK
jgi:hypothetical protein